MLGEALRLFEAYQQAKAGALQLLKSDIAEGMTDVRADRVSVVNMNTSNRKAVKIEDEGRCLMTYVAYIDLAIADLLDAGLYIAKRIARFAAGPDDQGHRTSGKNSNPDRANKNP